MITPAAIYTALIISNVTLKLKQHLNHMSKDKREREKTVNCSPLQGPPSPMITSSGSVSAGGRKASISSVTGGGGGFFGRKRITSTVSKRRGSDSSIEESTLQSRLDLAYCL